MRPAKTGEPIVVNHNYLGALDAALVSVAEHDAISTNEHGVQIEMEFWQHFQASRPILAQRVLAVDAAIGSANQFGGVRRDESSIFSLVLEDRVEVVPIPRGGPLMRSLIGLTT